jgi:hypothetical protein
MDTYEFATPVWLWEGKGSAWAFVTVPEGIADEVEDRQVGLRRGFGAVKVRVTLGESVWDTSMFPSKQHQSFILPLKAAVRKAEGVATGDAPRVAITLIPVA